MKPSSFARKFFSLHTLFFVSDVILLICMCFIHFFFNVFAPGRDLNSAQKTSCSTGRCYWTCKPKRNMHLCRWNLTAGYPGPLTMNQFSLPFYLRVFQYPNCDFPKLLIILLVLFGLYSSDIDGVTTTDGRCWYPTLWIIGFHKKWHSIQKSMQVGARGMWSFV